MKIKYKDFPFNDVVDKVIEQLKENPSLRFFQKFSCANCGNRLTMDEPNKFFKEGGCDKCGHITNIEKQGCNYMMFAASGPEASAKFDEILKRVRDKQ